MKTYFILILLLSLSSFGQNCSMLPDGKYEMRYDNQVENFQIFEISNDKYYYFENKHLKEYEIKRIGNCSFQIINEDVVDDSKLTELQKLLKNQSNYFEILKVEGNVYFFICRINLHVICGNGKIIKLN